MWAMIYANCFWFQWILSTMVCTRVSGTSTVPRATGPWSSTMKSNRSRPPVKRPLSKTTTCFLAGKRSKHAGNSATKSECCKSCLSAWPLGCVVGNLLVWHYIVKLYLVLTRCIQFSYCYKNHAGAYCSICISQAAYRSDFKTDLLAAAYKLITETSKEKL